MDQFVQPNFSSIGQVIPDVQKFEFYEISTHAYPDIFPNHFSGRFSSS